MMKPLKLVLLTLLGGVCISLSAQPIDLYCEIEGHWYVDELKKTNPAMGTLVYRIDAGRQSVVNTAGLFATDPVSVVNWTEFLLAVEQPYPKLTGIPGLTGFRVIRIDRTTGRFSITHEVRNAVGRALSQNEVNAEHEKSDLPMHPLFMANVGVAFGGQCAPRQKIF